MQHHALVIAQAPTGFGGIPNAIIDTLACSR